MKDLITSFDNFILESNNNSLFSIENLMFKVSVILENQKMLINFLPTSIKDVNKLEEIGVKDVSKKIQNLFSKTFDLETSIKTNNQLSGITLECNQFQIKDMILSKL